MAMMVPVLRAVLAVAGRAGYKPAPTGQLFVAWQEIPINVENTVGARPAQHKTVVPAKAGIQNPWEPARSFPEDFLDSGESRNDG